MKTSFLRLVFGCALSVLACTSIALGQTVTGAVAGEVTDSTGAVIAGAHVTAHNLDTAVDTSTTTNSVGIYRIEFLPIGHYQISVQANGFNTTTLPPFVLEVLQTATFNVKLAVGSSTATVSVTAAAPILNTNSPTLDTTFTANTVANMPLNGLDFSALTLYVPGSVNTAGTAGMTSIERSTFYTDTPDIDGNRTQANNYTLEGIDMNEPFNNLIGYTPAPEALAEVKVITADSPTDYGNVNGGGVVSLLKSGTNQFHGSAYGYVQDYRMNANSWSNKHSSPVIAINPFSQAQFGGTVGGPLLRNKLFFFADYLGSRWHQGGTGTASVMTDAMRTGDFSFLSYQLYDTQNGFAPYENNQVSIVNPVAKFLIANPSYYPLPNATPTDGIAANNYQAKQHSYKANDQGDVKLDYNFRSNDKIGAFFSKSTAYDGSTPVLAISFPGINIYPTWIGGGNWQHTFSPSMVNSARIGFTRVQWANGVPQDPTGAFGTSGDSKVGINFPHQAYDGFTGQGFGLSTAGNPANLGGLLDNTFSYIDNLSWQHRQHFLSMGVQALRYQNNYPTSNNQGYLGYLSYSGVFTANPTTGASGYGPADFLLDRVQRVQGTLTSVTVGQRQWRTAFFANDDYKIRPNLTLNIGLRWEYDQPWYEVNNKTGTVDPSTGQILYAHSVPTGAEPGSGVCSNPACYQPTFNQFMPHLGFAYQFNDRTVVRGGYGATSFFEGNSSNQRLTSMTPFIQAVNELLQAPTPTSPVAPYTAENAFVSTTTSYGGTYNFYPQHIQPAYVQNWNLTVEYALTHTASLQVGYVGEKGDHVENWGNYNQDKINGDNTSAPFYDSPFIGANVAANLQGYSIYNTNGGGMLITESRAMMNYNALQSILRQRLNHGLEFTLNYTYGKAMTNSTGNYALNTAGYNTWSAGAFQNYYDSGADYGPTGFDVRHNISATGVYALPAGYGREYFNSANRVMDEVVGGWKISVAAVKYSGFPETPLGPQNSNSNSWGNSRPNQYRKLKIVNRSLDHWFGTDPSAIPCTTAGVDNGTCAFGSPAENAFGTARNGALRGPGYLNVDLSAFKDFRIFGEQMVGFRFDAFNAFNISSYNNPDTSITDVDSNGNTLFGNVTNNGVRSNSRTLQFSAKYHF
jgi:hypothetical protein